MNACAGKGILPLLSCDLVNLSAIQNGSNSGRNKIVTGHAATSFQKYGHRDSGIFDVS
jgi:hypothetical protein